MEIKFKLYQEKKNSRRYKATSEDAVIRDIYVMRPYSDHKTELVVVIKDETSNS